MAIEKYLRYIFIFIVCWFIFSISYTADKKNQSQQKLLRKALVVLQQTSLYGSVEAKIETPGIWKYVRTEKTKEQLKKLLLEKNHEIMAQSAIALFGLGDMSGKEFLEQVLVESYNVQDNISDIERFKLTSQTRFRRIAAAEALGEIGDGSSLQLLRSMRSSEKDGQVRDACGVALAMLNDPAERMIFENAVNPSNHPEVRKVAVRSLGKIKNSSSLSIIKKALYDSEPSVRVEAAIALAAIGDPTTAEVLRASAEDDDTMVKREIIRALGNTVHPDNVPLLTNDLESGDGILSLIAAGALGQHGIFKGLRTVEVALKDKDRDVRIQAVEALSQIVDERSTAMLESMLADSDDIVRIKAAGAVIKRLLR